MPTLESEHSLTPKPVRDEAARNRYQTQLAPFITLRQPRSDSIRFIEDFARRTGDLQVLSGPDIRLLALTYELELERNNGDVWDSTDVELG
jgi:RNA-binding protein NOB1